MPGPHKFRHRFEGHVSRWTMPREAILEFLSRSSKHMSAKEIYASLYDTYPGMGLTTVYRTLDLLARMGIITKLTLGDGQSRYEFKSSKNPFEGRKNKLTPNQMRKRKVQQLIKQKKNRDR